MPTNTDAPEGLDLRKDGTVWLYLDDNERPDKTRLVKLRRPKMSELRRLRETEWEIAAEIRAFTEPLQDAVDAHLAEHDLKLGESLSEAPTEVLRTLRNLMRDRDQKGSIRAEELRGPWAAEAIELLSGVRVDEDDLPPWCFGVEFSAQLLGHWMSVPTHRGSP